MDPEDIPELSDDEIEAQAQELFTEFASTDPYENGLGSES